MKSVTILEIETEMNKDKISEVTKEESDSSSITREEVEESIHLAIPRLLDDDRVKKVIAEIIEEGGWIEDFEDYGFPEDYCSKFEIKVLNNY